MFNFLKFIFISKERYEAKAFDEQWLDVQVQVTGMDANQAVARGKHFSATHVSPMLNFALANGVPEILPNPDRWETFSFVHMSQN